ncbi:hypothetical protein [Halorubrum sp. F4]|uniref:hypothetical protein n=1 Tax=Halorubrum sp. F4 TaxID=2989715 RepID=UPI002480701B|nr:hypothetical protein [Halorubrum sp. F4]
MAKQKCVGLPIAEPVKRAIDIIPARAVLTPEMMIRRFPGPMTERADVPPAVELVLDANEFL